jgi:diguanylate cyclase (GGDEF)-like protein
MELHFAGHLFDMPVRLNSIKTKMDILKRLSLSGRVCVRLMVAGLCGIFLLAAGDTFAAQSDGLRVVDASQLEETPLSLSEYFDVLEDPSLNLTLTDVQKSEVAARFKTDSVAAEALGFGFTRSAYWLRFRLRNTNEHPLERMLEIGYNRIASIQLHQPVSTGAYQSLITGSAMPFATRPYKNRYFVFPVILPAHSEQVFYLRVQSANSLIVPARLWEPQAFHAYERNDYLAQAWYFGMVTAMVLFNLFLFIALRDVIYLLYVTFVTCMAIALAAQNGLLKEFLWLDSPLWSVISTPACYSLSLATMLVFMRHMLNTGTVIPKLDRLLKILIGIELLAPFALAASFQTFIKADTLFIVATLILTPCVTLLCAFKRQRSALFFLAAFAVLGFGGIVTGMRSMGVLPSNVLITNGLQFGSAVEMMLLAFALADRYNVIRREKAAAQREALEAHKLMVENLQSSERLLEARVAERTDELQLLNHKLEALSTTDGLTGIANRRRFDEVLESEWSRAARLGQSLALAMLDIDWFKKYNDHYGHQAGDECLRSVARVLTSNVCRSGDMVARYGGEEFVFIAPMTDAANAQSIARKICEAIQALAITHEMSEFGCVTASIGVAAMVPAEMATSDMLVKAADEALYRAKEQGRNRAVLA